MGFENPMALGEGYLHVGDVFQGFGTDNVFHCVVLEGQMLGDGQYVPVGRVFEHFTGAIEVYVAAGRILWGQESGGDAIAAADIEEQAAVMLQVAYPRLAERA